MARIGLILAIAAGLAWPQGRAPEKGRARRNLQGAGKIMNEAQTKAVQMLALPEQEYYSLNNARTLALQSAIRKLFQSGAPQIGPGPVALAPADAPLLAIGAPAKVRIDQRSGIPVLIATRLDGLRRWEAEYNQNTWAIMVDLDTGTVTHGQPFIQGKKELQTIPSMSGPRPEPPDSTTLLTSVRQIELRDFCAIDWRPSRLAVTVVYYDRISNAVEVELVSPQPMPRDLPGVEPSPFLTTGRPAAPAAIAQQGIALSVPANVEAGGAVNVRGLVNLPARDAVVRRGPDGAHVLMASMLFLQKDSRALGRIDLTLPAGLQPSAGGEQRVESTFGFDARAHTGEWVPAGEYLVYFVTGVRISGPYPLTVKTE